MTALQRVQQWASFARVWHLFDARWQNPFDSGVLIAKHLKGLQKPLYSEQSLCGDHVVVINCRHIALPGNEWRKRVFFHHQTYPGTATWTPAWEMHTRDPTMVMKKAVYTSMHGNLLRRHNMMRLHLYADEEVDPEVAARVTNVIRQLRPIPERLDLMEKEKVDSFPQIADLNKDYVIPELKEYPNWESQHQKMKRQGKKSKSSAK
ncbi:large ribosomal subunit protein uL13m [Neocloeon triangulifer]|uniref:large ribosomal subunit protein uL13m n=1 Tax=Neocloeon triangulifer TaxID=2078957 RepID=UPI00286F556E|nr:large ribosomal subunit protein uL13m [Neocloeon triangulifer]XP_059486238.1 large ribosomal subunit protein uL13m [Neocloeon triangulifer]